MLNKQWTIFVSSIIIAVVGVFGIDYMAHLLFSSPMETTPYFFAKMAWYIVFSAFFLSLCNLNRNEFVKVFIGGVAVSLMWGAYYNILPALYDFYPFGIALNGLTFLGMGMFGTGLAFGIVHTVAFIGGYYVARSANRFLGIRSL